MKCDVCFRGCELKEGQKGACLARINRNGEIVADNYGSVSSLALDPIEKKPIAFWNPGSLVISVGSWGCNLFCPFCQNHEIAKNDLKEESQYVSPQDLVELALDYVEDGNIGIAYTYNEPLVGYEYVRDTARLAREKGLKNVLVTNGSVTEKVLDEILPYIDAMNIDLKGFSQEYYDYVGGDLKTVKKFIEKAAKSCHVEVTTLLVPGKNTDPEEIEELAKFLASIDPDIPLHLTRYFPRYREVLPPTALAVMEKAREAARKHLNRVVLGNV